MFLKKRIPLKIRLKKKGIPNPSKKVQKRIRVPLHIAAAGIFHLD